MDLVGQHHQPAGEILAQRLELGPIDLDAGALHRGPDPESVKRRVASSVGHLNNEQAARLLETVGHPDLQWVVALHISEQNNSPDDVRDSLEGLLTGDGQTLYLAAQNTPSEWLRTPGRVTGVRGGGTTVATAGRRRGVWGQVAERCPAVRGVVVGYGQFAHTERDLSNAERALLDTLLTYGSQAEPANGGRELIVVPRLGRISPWASKATDIARICGLPIQRLERGRLYTLDLATSVSPEEFQSLLSLLHDRMTESALSDPVTEALLFAEHESGLDEPAAALVGDPRRTSPET